MEDSYNEILNPIIQGEQFYYGYNASAQNEANTISALNEVQEKKSVWTHEEIKGLQEAMQTYGTENWEALSNHVKTKDPIQCKMYWMENLAFQNVLQNADQKKPITNTGTVPDNNDDHQVSSLTPENSNLEMKSQEPLLETEVNQVGTDESSETDKIDRNTVSEDEKKNNMEWFLGRQAKTPERYMRIRNHILDCWKSTRPYYLTKTAGRKNLSNCGDVNAVGRVHAYLENIGAINVNCPQQPPRPVKRTYNEDGTKRKSKKAPGYYWADVDSEEDTDTAGYFKTEFQRNGKRPKRTVNRPETFYSDANDFGFSNDPFRLVPVGYYPHESKAPFSVEIDSDAMLVMEFHSHLAYTEIIGLLGGTFETNEENGTRKLKVEYVFPCRSTSTGTQCEMDPVSEMAAREVFEKRGLNVVGWYHSHPTFEPDPSIRDIENQASYQGLFRDEVSGDEPFIGVIVTPYNLKIGSERSQSQVIHISKRWNTNKSYRLPFACFQQIRQNSKVSVEIWDIFLNLLKEYKSYEHKIDMALFFGQKSRLDKLIQSLKVHLFMDPESSELFLNSVRNMVQDYFIGDKSFEDVDQNNTFAISEPKKSTEGIIESLAI
ncbi:hypothetical protein K501DRAFT_333501 [Backusella circina FSU 941]|nr:hypothetical protein K501DRAFT_333501 [Backusella circina FSU 941]